MTVVQALSGCDLSDLTSGDVADAGGSAGDASSGGTSSGGGGTGVGGGAGDPCDGWTFCELFEEGSAPDPTRFAPIRVEGDTSLVISGGALVATSRAAVDCAYADIGLELSSDYVSFEYLTSIRRSEAAQPFLLTLNQGGASGCLHLLGLDAEGLVLQTNRPDGRGGTTSELTATRLALTPGVEHEVRLSGVVGPAGLELNVTRDGQQAPLSRPACVDSVGLTITLGMFCYGGTGVVEYGDLRLRLE